MATARREHFGKLLEPGLTEIFYEVYDQQPLMYKDLFKIVQTDNPYEEDVSIGTLGKFPDFEGVVEYDRPYEGYSVVYEFPEMAKGFRIERKLWDDERYDTINKKPAALAIEASRRQEEDAASIFNNAFDASYTGPDGKALIASDHPSKAYVDTGGSEGIEERSNVIVVDSVTNPKLSHKNLQGAKNLMRDIRNDRGNKISVVPDTLLVPPALEEEAWMLMESDKQIHTRDNNPNIHEGRYTLMVWDELSNDDAWFLISSNYKDMFLKWYERIPLEFEMEEEFDTLVAKFRGYMRYGAGWSDWIWIMGSDGSES